VIPVLIPGPAADAPTGTHAFIVGVSHYPFADGPNATRVGEDSGIASLSGAAKSASDVAAWVLQEYRNPDAPLASVRLLMSPTWDEEINPYIAGLMGDTCAAPATRDAFETEFFRFRQECKSSPENVAFVYVAGHGVQLNKRGAIILLHDFAVAGRDVLYGAADVVGCHNAMDEDGNAHHQLWFSDACRQRMGIARRFETLSGAYRPDEGLGRVDSTPMYLAASTRESAFGTISGNTIFSEALLAALRGAAAVGPDPRFCTQWHVSATKLAQYLPRKVDELLAGRETQNVDVTGRVRDMVAHQFDEPPDVDIVVHLNPAEAQPIPVAALLFDGREPCDIDPSWPLKFRGDAGLYSLTVQVSPPLTKGAIKLIDANPPGCEENVEVS
jgi:hypothetical protein